MPVTVFMIMNCTSQFGQNRSYSGQYIERVVLFHFFVDDDIYNREQLAHDRSNSILSLVHKLQTVMFSDARPPPKRVHNQTRH